MFLLRLIFSPLRLLLFCYFRLHSRLAKKKVLVHSMPERFVMNEPTGYFSFLSSYTEQGFTEYLSLLHTFERDEVLEEFAYRVPDMQAPWSQVEQIGSLLRRIAASGKRLSAHTQGGNLKTLYLMAPAHRRSASECANFSVLLPSFDSYFAKEALSRLGVGLDVQTAGRYKGGGFETFTHTSFSPENRRTLSALIRDMRDSIRKGFAETCGLSRDMGEATFRLLQNQSLVQDAELRKTGFLGKDPLPSLGLVDFGISDRIPTLYGIEAQHSFGGPAENRGGTKGIDFGLRTQVADENYVERRYRRSRYPAFRFRGTPSLGVVIMEGPIQLGRPGENPRPHSISALAFQELLQKLMENRDEAVFLYIDSPGGSADASEILFESIYCLSRIKPVFALLGSVAASGGYYIASAANRIYASPLSITGSIGVIRIRPNLEKLYKKIGIRKERLIKDRTGDIYSETGKLSAHTQRLLKKSLGQSYDLFLRRVALGRNKGKGDLPPVAEGRVFTGAQFERENMVDGSWNFIQVLEEYKKSCGVPSSMDYRLHYYPRIRFDIQSLASEYLPLGGKFHGFLPDFLGEAEGSGRPLYYTPLTPAIRNL